MALMSALPDVATTTVPTSEARSALDLPVSWGWPEQDTIDVDAPYRQLLPAGGLAGGQLVTVTGATSVVLALLARPSREGSWCALVGAPTVGLAAAQELGVDLRRLLLIPKAADRFSDVLTALIDAVDIVAFQLPPQLPQALLRRLIARARTRRVPLVAFAPPGTYPTGSGNLEGATVHLAVQHRWSGLGDGHGHLRQRRMDIRATGRGRAARPTHVEVVAPEVASISTALATAEAS